MNQRPFRAAAFAAALALAAVLAFVSVGGGEEADAATSITGTNMQYEVSEDGKTITFTPTATSPVAMNTSDATIWNKINGAVNVPNLEKIIISGFTTVDKRAFLVSDASIAVNVTEVAAPGLTQIQDWAFKNCKKLAKADFLKEGYGTNLSLSQYCMENTGFTSITIPSTVTSVAEGAFYNCLNLVSMDTGPLTSLPARFAENCRSMTTLVMPKVTTTADGGDTSSKENGCFYKCTSLTDVYAPVLKTIGRMTFHRCTALESISLPEATDFKNWSFKGCTKLSSVYAPKVTNLRDYCFEDTNFTEITIPTTLGRTGSVSLGYGVFSFSEHLKFLDTGPLVTIPKRLAEGCTSLKTLIMPNAVSTESSDDGTGCFLSCWSLTEVSAPKLTNMGNYTFHGCSSLESISLPEVTSIGKLSFKLCSSLKNIEFPKLQSLGSYALEKTGLVSITIPDSLTALSEGALYDCPYLEDVTIGTGTATIGRSSLQDCPNLKSVHLTRTGSTSFDANAFKGSHVPDQFYLEGSATFQSSTFPTTYVFKDQDGDISSGNYNSRLGSNLWTKDGNDGKLTLSYWNTCGDDVTLEYDEKEYPAGSKVGVRVGTKVAVSATHKADLAAYPMAKGAVIAEGEYTPEGATTYTVEYRSAADDTHPMYRGITLMGYASAVAEGKEIVSGSTFTEGTVVTISIPEAEGRTGHLFRSGIEVPQGDYTLKNSMEFEGSYTCTVTVKGDAHVRFDGESIHGTVSLPWLCEYRASVHGEDPVMYINGVECPNGIYVLYEDTIVSGSSGFAEEDDDIIDLLKHGQIPASDSRDNKWIVVATAGAIAAVCCALVLAVFRKRGSPSSHIYLPRATTRVQCP